VILIHSSSFNCNHRDHINLLYDLYDCNVRDCFGLMKWTKKETMGSLLSFYCQFFCYKNIGGAKELVVLLWLSGDIQYKQWTKRVGLPLTTWNGTCLFCFHSSKRSKKSNLHLEFAKSYLNSQNDYNFPLLTIFSLPQKRIRVKLKIF